MLLLQVQGQPEGSHDLAAGIGWPAQIPGDTRLQGQLLDGRPVGRGRVQMTHMRMTAGAQHKLPLLHPAARDRSPRRQSRRPTAAVTHVRGSR